VVLEGEGGGELLVGLVQGGDCLGFGMGLFLQLTLLILLFLLKPFPQLLHQLFKFPHFTP
jgi:hypothetical protein